MKSALGVVKITTFGLRTPNNEWGSWDNTGASKCSILVNMNTLNNYVTVKIIAPICIYAASLNGSYEYKTFKNGSYEYSMSMI